MTFTRGAITIICALFAAIVGTAVLAQPYPNKPVRLIVPFPPGGSSDTAARLIGQKLVGSPTWGQPVIVENKPGANTMLAANQVAQAAPDGYTIFSAVDSTMTMNPFVIRNVTYVPDRDFTPITLLTDQPLLLTVHPDKLKARSMRDLVEELKGAPGKFNLGTGALVTQGTAELIKAVAGVNLVIVPLRGGADTLKTILSGAIELAMSDVAPYVSHIREGRLAAIAVTKSVRTSALPDVPTMAESGFPEIDIRTWNGLFGPRALPRDIVMKINQEVTRILRNPEIRARLASLGLEASPTTPEELARIVKTDAARWEKVLKNSGIRID